MVEISLPEESDSQRIGHNASKCFSANCPDSWRIHSLEGTDDAGFDYQVQIVDNGKYKDIFRVQLKGTESPSLNSTGEYFSISLKARTINYYSRCTEPILLVLCDLSVNLARPILCPSYFVWIHDEIQRHMKAGLSSESQSSLTIRVPTANLITSSLNLSEEIEAHRRIYKAAKTFEQSVEAKLPAVGPEARADILEKISGGFAQRSSSLIEQLSAPVTSPWPEAPRNSMAGRLNDVAQKLASGLTDAAKSKLSEISGDFLTATTVEQAEYWYLQGKCYSQESSDESAIEAYKKAVDFSPGASRYKVAWIEAEFISRFERPTSPDFTDLLSQLTLSSNEEVILKARILAGEGNYVQASEILNTIPKSETFVARAMIATMQSSWLEVIKSCDEGIVQPQNKDETKQLLYLFRARARFHLAISQSASYSEGRIVPIFGPADLDIFNLRLAWDDIEKTVELMGFGGWPTNIDYIADVWGSACLMLGKEVETLKVMQAVTNARPKAIRVQVALERVAMQCNEWDAALNANSMQPSSQEQTLRRIMLLYQAQRYSECVYFIENNLDTLQNNSEISSLCISLGILAADEIVRPDLANTLQSMLEKFEGWEEENAVLDYYRSLAQNVLKKDVALKKLEDAYEKLGKPIHIGVQLFHAYDAFDIEQAEKSLQVAETLRNEQQLSVEAELHVAQAYTTLGKWEALLELVNSAIERFAHVSRFKAIRAFALDKLGHSSDALSQLKEIIQQSDYDDVAVNTYINIAVRCGFSEEAISLVEKLLGQEAKKPKKFRLLKLLFGLVHNAYPQSQRAEEIAWRMGLNADRSAEDEEGVFILCYLASTLSSSINVAESRRSELHERIAEFTSKFPTSKIFRVGSLPEGAPPEEMLKILNDLIGGDAQAEEFRSNISKQLERGEIAIPFSWRPRNIINNVPDLAALWQVCKSAKRDARQYHLNMVDADWKGVPYDSVKGKIPIFDLITLFVLLDLKLFSLVFKIFPKIAISQGTLIDLQRLATPMVGSWASSKCQELINLLKSNIANIVQPAIGGVRRDRTSEEDAIIDHDEVKELLHNGRYILYSDDSLYRVFVNPHGLSICTLDLLEFAEDLNLISPGYSSEIVGQLCDWNVTVAVQSKHLIGVIPAEANKARSVQEVIDLIQRDSISAALFEGVWNVRKKYTDIQSHLSFLIAKLLSDPRNNIQTISGIVGVWYGRARLRTDVGNILPLKRLALLMAQVFVHVDEASAEFARGALKVYLEIVGLEWGDRMDEAREKDSIKEFGRTVAEIDFDVSSKISTRLEPYISAGFIKDTAEGDYFASAYADAMLKLKLAEN